VIISKKELETWLGEQIKALVLLGYPTREATRTLKWVLDNCPVDEDPRTWIPLPGFLAAEPAPSAHDAELYAERWRTDDDVPNEWKLLLDAVLMDEED